MSTEISELVLHFKSDGSAAVKGDLRSIDAGIKGIQEHAGKTGGALRSMFSTAGGFVGAQVAIGVFRDVKNEIGSVFTAASDTTETINKAFAVFGQSGGQQVIRWASDAAQNL